MYYYMYVSSLYVCCDYAYMSAMCYNACLWHVDVTWMFSLWTYQYILIVPLLRNLPVRDNPYFKYYTCTPITFCVTLPQFEKAHVFTSSLSKEWLLTTYMNMLHAISRRTSLRMTQMNTVGLMSVLWSAGHPPSPPPIYHTPTSSPDTSQLWKY